MKNCEAEIKLKMQIWIGIHMSGPILEAKISRAAKNVMEKLAYRLEMSWDGSSARRKPTLAIVWPIFYGQLLLERTSW